MSFIDVCRLCLSEKDLMCVFENRVDEPVHLKEVIFITTGVEILEKDVVSKKICGNCCKVTVKMFEFRERSVKTDKYLKEQCTEYLKGVQVKIPHTDVLIKTGKTFPQKIPKTSEPKPHILKNNKIIQTKTSNESTSETKTALPKILRKVHPTVSDIFTIHPNIKLPTSVLPFDVSPSVCMELDSVEDYYGRNNLDMNKAVQQALRSSRATKKTSPANKQKEILQNKPCTSSSEHFVETSTIKNIASDDNFVEPKPNTSVTSEERCITDRRVSPISIKLVDSKSVFKVVSKENAKRQIDDGELEEPLQRPSKLKRRRLSSDDFTSETEPKHPTLMDTLQLKPNDDVHICNICKSVQKTAKALKKHLQEHFRCNFCNTKFSLVELKETHETKCVVKHALVSETYVQLYIIDLDLEARKKYPALNFHKTDDAIADENPQYQLSAEANTTENTDVKNKDVEIIELSDDDEQDVPSTSKPILCTAVASTGMKINESHVNLSVNSLEGSSNALVDMQPKLIPLSNLNSMPNGVPYYSAAKVQPDIKIKDNYMLNTIDMSTSDVKVLKNLLTRNSSADFKMSVDGEAQTELPSNNQIIRHSGTTTADLKGLFPQLYVFKIPVNIQKGDFNVSYTQNISQKQKNMHLWNDLKAVDVKSTSCGYLNTAILNKKKTRGVLMLKPSKNDNPQALATAVFNSNPGLNLLTGQNLANNITPISHQTIHNIRQNIHQQDNRIVHVSAATASAHLTSRQSVPAALNRTASQTATYTPNTSTNTIQNVYYLQPRAPIVATNNNQRVSTPGTSNALMNGISEHQAYLPQNVSVNSNNIQDCANTNTLSKIDSCQQNLNVCLSYSNNNNLLHSLPSLTDDPVISTLVLPSCNTLSGTFPQPNINPFSEKGIFGQNRTENNNTAIVSADSNNVPNAIHSSIGQTSVPSTSGISNAANTVTRPFIRVRNLCELK